MNLANNGPLWDREGWSITEMPASSLPLGSNQCKRVAKQQGYLAS